MPEPEPYPDHVARGRSCDARLWQAICQATAQLVQERDMIRTLRSIVSSVQRCLGVDRVGIFYFNRPAGELVRLIGVDPRGELEFEARQPISMDPVLGGPLRQVARG